MSDSHPRRFYGLDAIRGVAALLVALRHVPFLAPLSRPESFLAVDLFFVLSGVVLCDAYTERLRAGLTLKHFMCLRAIRLYPLYLLGTLLGLTAIGVGYPAPHGNIAAIAICAILAVPYAEKDLYPLDRPAWSLFLEMIASLGFGISVRFGLLRMLAALAGLSATALVLEVAFRSGHTLDLGWKPSTILAGLSRVGFSFSLGVVLRCGFQRFAPLLSRLDGRGLMAWPILAVTTGLLAAAPPAALRPVYELAVVLFAFPALVLLMMCCRVGPRSRRIFSTLGALSYPLYVLHCPLAQIVEPLAHQLGLPLTPTSLSTGLAALALIAALCLWLERAFDRPFRIAASARLVHDTDRRRPYTLPEGRRRSPFAGWARRAQG